MTTSGLPPPANADALPSDSLGRYTPIASLGAGGMADVYLAVARGMEGFNKLAVVKRLRLSSEEVQIRMFLDEARLAARLAHPNIVHTYEVGESKGSYFIAMEYLEGQSLDRVARLLRSRGEPFPEVLAARVLVSLLKALHYTHELRDYDGTPLHCVHRDVSPQNVYVTYSGEVKLLDFGIAKAALNTTVTESGEIKGKVRYMSPEQIAGVDVDGRADVYAAGVVLWELLARRKLHEGDAVSTMNSIVNDEPPRLSSVRPGCDPKLDAIVARALRLEREARYRTADEMRVDLEAYLREHPDRSDETALTELMTRLFADARAEVQAQIQSFLADATSSGLDSAPALPTLRVGGSGSIKGGATPSGVGVLPAAQTIRARSLARFVVGGLLVAAGAAAPVAALRYDSARGSAGTSAAAPALTAVPATYQARVRSEPSGALVEWNGKPMDRTPATVTLPAGAQTLVVSREGFEPESIVVEPADGATIVERAVVLRASMPTPPAPAPAPAASGSASASASASVSVASAARHPPPPTKTKAAGASQASSSATAPLRIRVVDDGDNP
jgi:serine/threonine protein kinase